MGASRQKSKDSKSQGVVIALFVALFVIGGGAAYLIISNRSNNEEQDEEEQVIEQKEQEEVAEAKSLVEVPPPLPENPPNLTVIEEEVLQNQTQKKKTGKKYLPATGTIDAKVARSFIKSRSNKVRACYEKELKVNNLLRGKVTTQILINTDGSVANVRFLSDTVGSPMMKTCIRKEIISWKFPKPVGGRAEVQFPFRFEPKQ